MVAIRKKVWEYSRALNTKTNTTRMVEEIARMIPFMAALQEVGKMVISSSCGRVFIPSWLEKMWRQMMTVLIHFRLESDRFSPIRAGSEARARQTSMMRVVKRLRKYRSLTLNLCTRKDMRSVTTSFTDKINIGRK